MSFLEQLKQRIEFINSKVNEVNNQRNRNIGIKENLTAQLKQNIADYQAKYGVDLSSKELINAEFERVLAEKEKELGVMESVIDKIGHGDYTGANALLGVEPPKESKTANTVENVAQPTTEGSVAQPTMTNPVGSVAEPTAPSPVGNIAQPVEASPVGNIAQPAPVGTVAQPMMASPVDNITEPTPISPVSQAQPLGVLPEEDFLAGFEKPAVPPAPPMATPTSESPSPAPVNNPMSFDAILGGTQFQA